MRYHYEQKYSPPEHGRIYRCNHQLYSVCTLFEKDGKGLAIVQTKYDAERKVLYLTRIPAALANDIYNHPKFNEYFEKYAEPAEHELYPTINVRSVMWALRMRPLEIDNNVKTFYNYIR